MEAPNAFAGYGKITDLDLTDFGFHIDDLLNISNEEIAGPIGDDDTNNNSSSNNTKWAGDVTENSSSQRCRCPLYGNYDAETEEHYTLTCSDDLAELEWLSNFVEDSFSMDNGATKPPSSGGRDERPPNNNNEEIGSSAGPEMCSSTVPVRARSKRARRPPVSNWYNSHILLFDTRHSPSGLEINAHSNNNSSLSANGPKDQCSGAEIVIPAKKLANAKRYGTMRLKKAKDENGPPAQTTRRCMHCAIQRTPQWRAGPLGPKTLCNACGVRYKSGRLFPEYRPAASPTFVLSQHSNSHKRVLQMRQQKLESPIDEELQGKGHGFHSPPRQSHPYPFARPNYTVIRM